MKTTKISLAIIFSAFALLITSCKKEEKSSVAHVKVKIDYLGSGGYYNDDIDGVPSGLVLGSNGPYNVDPNKTYTLTYKAASNFNEVHITGWSPTTDVTWVIHCYMVNNVEHIETYYE